MGVIEASNYITIDRQKVYVLKKGEYAYVSLGSIHYNHDGVMGYFTSEDKATKYVQQLINDRVLVAVNVGKNKFGDDIIHYTRGQNYMNTFPIYIEEHEMDLDANEFTSCKITYPNIKPEITIKNES